MRSAGPEPGDQMRRTVSAQGRTLRAEIDRKLASGGGLDALPQRLPRAGRACDTVPGPDEYPPRPCIRLVIRPRAKVRPGPRFSTSRRQRTQGLCASPATEQGDYGRGCSHGGMGTLYCLEGAWSQGVGRAGYADNRRIVSIGELHEREPQTAGLRQMRTRRSRLKCGVQDVARGFGGETHCMRAASRESSVFPVGNPNASTQD